MSTSVALPSTSKISPKTTFAPSRQNIRASQAPCPRAPPLIRAIFPSSLPMPYSSLCHRYSSVTPLINEVGHETTPAGLVCSPQTVAVITMEILVELQIIAPVRILLPHTLMAVDGASAGRIPRKDTNQAIGKAAGDVVWRHHAFPRGGTGNSKLTAVSFTQFPQGFDHHKGRGKPQRAAPVGIPTFDFFQGFPRTVAHDVLTEHVGMRLVVFGQTAQATLRAKFGRIPEA